MIFGYSQMLVTHSSIYKSDVMKSFLLGYLYFYIVIYPVKSSDLVTSWEISNSYISFDNCTQCNVKPHVCNCLEDRLANKCLVCCSDVSCCFCYDCTCRQNRQLIIMTQIAISILFTFGFLGLIIIYCKICSRTRRQVTRGRCIVLQEQELDRTNCSVIEDLRERPPPYNEVPYSAPPLYTSPYNRTSMQEAPPSYPGTPKPQERSEATEQTLSRHSVFVASSIAQHM
ncbi:LOW QUALITY PROTEIN: uncharacterized protein LOC114928310 [Nylanderia fulva]|uniref:LOW QUALITY PROTEIN: uncharacterized protein LOC114928310 n=1 Tax=Nylanderia fulva TaxID=613905 RepID=UPI0010FB5BD7|nr:LOW QUALITY PROTEIN: uncharacterized protein LOC114928310 [Nylanderia fulva]